jgi:UDP-N-acetylglucosamine:LPS N-acetylglucosamine transferase
MHDCKILICFSDTGAGHRSAAWAIARAIEEIERKHGEQGHVTVVAEEVAKESSIANHALVWVYNFFLAHCQGWMKYYYNFIEWLQPDRSALGYWLSSPYLKKVILRARPCVLVSVHPMINHHLAGSLSELGMERRTKLIVVITDPNGSIWSGWACPGADLTIAPNDLAKKHLVALGLDESRVHTIGMPIDPKFVQPPVVERHECLERLGLDSQKLTILLSAGAEGGSDIAGIYRALQAVQRPAQVIVLCGHNDGLKRRMEQASKHMTMPTAVLHYSDAMSDLMNASDLLITKAGGLTTFEAIARKLPMAINMLSAPMPQEMGTVRMLIDAKLAQPIRRPDDIVPIVESLELDLDRKNKLLPEEHSLHRVDAVYEIAATILSSCSVSQAKQALLK